MTEENIAQADRNSYSQRGPTDWGLPSASRCPCRDTVSLPPAATRVH